MTGQGASDVHAVASPVVAFGLHAAALALKAKTGKRVSLVDIADLAQMQVQLLPDDGDVARAVTRFLARWADDPIAAGAGLQAFLIEWRAPTSAVAAPVPGQASDPVVVHAWQARADAGLD